MVNINWSCAECGRKGFCGSGKSAIVIHEALSPKCKSKYMKCLPDQVTIVFERKDALGDKS